MSDDLKGGKMRRMILSFVGLAAASMSLSSAKAQPARLPIAEGVWVKTDVACSKAFIAHVYAAKRFGTVYFYGPNQSMGPANETEVLTHVGRGMNGFSVVNDGPLEVAARAAGQAVVRAFSPSQRVQWSDTVRLCPPATLSAKMRAGLARTGLLPSSSR